MRYPYVLADKDNLVPMGILEARPAKHKIELGYVSAPALWGHGFMPEAISALCIIAMKLPGVFRMQAFCDVDNHASQRALEKANFTCEGRHERFVVHPNLSPEPRPCYMYAKCR